MLRGMLLWFIDKRGLMLPSKLVEWATSVIKPDTFLLLNWTLTPCPTKRSSFDLLYEYIKVLKSKIGIDTFIYIIIFCHIWSYLFAAETFIFISGLSYAKNEDRCFDIKPSINRYSELKLQRKNVRDLIEIDYFLNRDIIATSAPRTQLLSQ